MMESDSSAGETFLVVSAGNDFTGVLDADEEIFDLYSGDVGSPTRQTVDLPGLGFVDSKQAIISVELTFHDDRDVMQLPASGSGSLVNQKRRSNLSSATRKTKNKAAESRTISATIAQDLHALRNRKGDTGSVIWRSSLLLAERILQQHFFPPSGAGADQHLLIPASTANASVLELGGGTGILAILLGPFFKKWICTDQFDNLKLIQKNLKLNGLDVDANPHSKITVDEVDWISVATDLERGKFKGPIDPFDLVIATDCIYNEALTKPLARTLTAYTTPGKTAALVVAELRSSDVMMTFLSDWLAEPDWSIKRLGSDVLGKKLAHKFVVWLGVRDRKEDGETLSK